MKIQYVFHPFLTSGGCPVAQKGRGTVWRIQPRFDNLDRQEIDDGWGSLEDDHLRQEEAAPPATVLVEEQVRTILSRNDSPDVGFDLSINPYRGCEHGCIYCYARPTHSYLGLSPGLDFETHIVGKINAAERLRQALAKPGYRPVALNIGSVTDAYQPAERRLQITRSLIEVLAEFRHPFSIITKSAGILRDIDLLAPLAAQGLVAVYLSVTTLDPALARILEPRAASPHRRLEAVSALTQAGIPVGVSVSPVIPFLNEPDIERVVEAAAAAGARSGFSIPLRLPWEVAPLFEQWLNSHFPNAQAGSWPGCGTCAGQGQRRPLRSPHARRRHLGRADAAAFRGRLPSPWPDTAAHAARRQPLHATARGLERARGRRHAHPDRAVLIRQGRCLCCSDL
jgi:DNA repair photolyase